MRDMYLLLHTHKMFVYKFIFLVVEVLKLTRISYKNNNIKYNLELHKIYIKKLEF